MTNYIKIEFKTKENDQYRQSIRKLKCSARPLGKDSENWTDVQNLKFIKNYNQILDIYMNP